MLVTKGFGSKYLDWRDCQFCSQCPVVSTGHWVANPVKKTHKCALKVPIGTNQSQNRALGCTVRGSNIFIDKQNMTTASTLDFNSTNLRQPAPLTTNWLVFACHGYYSRLELMDHGLRRPAIHYQLPTKVSKCRLVFACHGLYV